MISSIKTGQPPYKMIALLLIGAFIALLNNTLLGIAIPAIMSDFDINASTAQWLTTGYMLVIGILIPITAFLVQKFSIRQLFLSSLCLFIIGTLIAGFSTTFSLLLAGRMVQASGAAVMSPLLMNVMLVSFPIEKRGTAMGMTGLVMMGAPAVGPLLSGWIVQSYDWRMLFLFVAPLAMIILILGFWLIKDKQEHNELRLDYVSFLFSTIGFGGLLYGFSSAGNLGWSHVGVYGAILLGTSFLIAFILRQQRQERPMLNFSVFHYPIYALSITISMIVAMTLFSSMILMPIYFIDLRHIPTFQAGLIMVPGALMLAVCSPIVGRLFDKYGGRVLAVVGLSIITVTSYYLSQLTFETSYLHLILLNTTRMIGISFVMMPVATTGFNHLPKQYYTHGTAMNNTFQQVAGAIGTALLITIMSIRTDHHFGQLNTSPSEVERLNDQAMLLGINDAFSTTILFAIIALALASFLKPVKQEKKEKLSA